MSGFESIPYFGIGFFSGAVISGIIGAVIPSHESYDMNKFKSDKKAQIEKILKKEILH